MTVFSSGLTITVPNNGDENWGTTSNSLCFQKISEHDHTGSGKGLQIGTAAIANLAVTSAKLADGSVTSAKFGALSLATANIQDSAVTSAKIANDAITSDKILDANVNTAKLFDACVTTAKIADSNVTTAKIFDGSITTAKLAAFAVTDAGFRLPNGQSILGRNAANSANISLATLGSDDLLLVNEVGYINLKPRAAPGSPGSGVFIYIDSGDGNKLKARHSTGTINTLSIP